MLYVTGNVYYAVTHPGDTRVSYIGDTRLSHIGDTRLSHIGDSRVRESLMLCGSGVRISTYKYKVACSNPVAALDHVLRCRV